MDTLISIGTLAAWAWSATVVVAFPGSTCISRSAP